MKQTLLGLAVLLGVAFCRAEELESRSYRFAPSAYAKMLLRSGADEEERGKSLQELEAGDDFAFDTEVLWRRAFSSCGVQWPVDARLGIDKRRSRLEVTNTPANLAVLEKAMREMLLMPFLVEVDARFVRAKGNILAETWYELSAVCPTEELQKTPCGISGSRYALVVGKRRINLYPDSGKTIDECDKIIKEYKLGAEGLFSMPVKLIREQRQKYKTSPETLYDTAQMERKLTDTLRQSVAGEINSMRFREGKLNGVYVLTLRAHCTEQIGETVPLIK